VRTSRTSVERYGEFPSTNERGYLQIIIRLTGRKCRGDGGYQRIADFDVDFEKASWRQDGMAATWTACLYLQHPNDAVAFLKFEEKYGKTWAPPAEDWFIAAASTWETSSNSRTPMGAARDAIGPQRAERPGYNHLPGSRSPHRPIPLAYKKKALKQSEQSTVPEGNQACKSGDIGHRCMHCK